ncbi:MAG TPA: hypothetical protein VGO11_19625 [Chthoniobacteraceae bacterium]|jgi:hypothetical protein|nr:hypothetical protein [Chthoniobacteraceae bacterium]
MTAIHGLRPPKPIRCSLPGRVRLRMRQNDFASIYVYGGGSIRQFIAMETDTHFEPCLELEQGRNFTDDTARRL